MTKQLHSGFCTYFWWVNPRNFNSLLRSFRGFSRLSLQQCPATGILGGSSELRVMQWVWVMGLERTCIQDLRSAFKKLEFRFLYWCNFNTWLGFFLVFSWKGNSTKLEQLSKMVLAFWKQTGFAGWAKSQIFHISATVDSWNLSLEWKVILTRLV